MPKVATITRKNITPLERFLGGEARILKGSDMQVSNCITMQWLDVWLPGNDLPEEQGRLYLYPSEEGRFCLQLFYLQQADNTSQTVSVCSIQFLPAFFDQYPADVLMAHQPFRFDRTTEQQFTVCNQSVVMLAQLQTTETHTPLAGALHRSHTAISLLRRALDCISIPFMVCQVPACRFLAYESEREKIQAARQIIEQNMDQPQTIKELSRKVAMNECYLKKGFKALTGKTIHEYQQELRINKAKELLEHGGQSVTDVANTLGYSSISHFSTAFKRVTGLKPCELLA